MPGPQGADQASHRFSKIDPVDDNCDLAIRIDPSPDERIVGRRILENEHLLVPPGLAVALQPEREAADHAVPAVDRGGTPGDRLWRIKTDTATKFVQPHIGLRFWSFLMVRDAVLARTGAALVPKMMVTGDIDAARPVSWGARDCPRVEIWAVQNAAACPAPRCGRFQAR